MGGLQRSASEKRVRNVRHNTCGIRDMTAAERLATGFSHQINNYLTGIISFTELSMMKLRPEDAVYPILAKSLQLAWKAVDLTGNVSLFAGKNAEQAIPLDINRVVRLAISGMAGLFDDNIAIKTDLDPDICKIMAVPSLMETVIRNLVINAAEAMPTGGIVSIKTSRVQYSGTHTHVRRESVELSVSDTGNGMTAEVMSRMFEPFFTTKEPGKNAGLGLSIVHRIAKQCGAKIGIDSATGKGTTVAIIIPHLNETASSEAKDGLKPCLMA